VTNQDDTSELSPKAIAAWQTLLSQPMPPGHLVEYAECLNRVMGEALIIKPGSSWARESHLGARFSKALNAQAVWLQDQPDLILIGPDGVQRRYELTEALEPGRRRNQEYREDRAKRAAGQSAARAYDPDNVDSTKEALRKASAAKASKADIYASEPTGLVIYLNTDLHAFRECVSLLEASLHDETSSASQSFCEVWVLWAGRLYLVWRDGKPEPLRPLVNV